MRSLTIRALALGSVAALAAVGLAGCDSGGSDTNTLTFFSWDNEETMRPIIDAFEDANPDITVEFSTAPPVAEYISTLQTRLLSDTAADVFLIAAENKTNLIENSYVKDLSDYDFVNVMNPLNRDTYSVDGKSYGLSTSSWGGGILYNKALTDAVGMTEEPQSWQEFLDLCAKLKDSGVAPYYESLQGGNLMTLWSLVGQKFDAEGGGVDAKIFDGTTTFAAEWEEPLTTYAGLFTEGVMPQEVVGLDDNQILDEFMNGRVAMIGTGPWQVTAVKEGAPDLDFSFMQVPTDQPGNLFLAGAASPGYAINANAKNPEAAEKFLAFLADPATVEMYQKATQSITTTTGYTPVVDPSLDEIVAGINDGKIYLPFTAWPEYQDALRVELLAKLQEMAMGQLSPTQVLDAMDARLAELQK